MLRRAETIGVFQLEGGAMRTTAALLAPTRSTTSRPSSPSTGPGPMAANMHRDYPELKNGRKPIDLPPP